MKKGIRFYFTFWFVKFVMKVMKLLGRRATHLPGVIAYKLCPDILSRIGMPNKVIAITGTNGKTTTANMISDFLKSKNISYMHNNYGSNTVHGVIASFISFCDWKGNIDRQFGIIEVDERSSYRIYKDLTPDYLVVTNLFRDSSKRNAHAEYIFDIIDDATPDRTKMILNADDLISARLKPNSERVYYSIDLLENEEEIRDSRIKDIENCPICNHKLIPDFIRYNHIGRYRCDNCGFESPKADYVIHRGNLEEKWAVITHKEKDYKFNLQNTNIVDLYNLLSAVVTLSENGFSMEELESDFQGVEVVKSRYNDVMIGDRRLVYMMAKAINPISASRTFDYIRKQEGNIAIIFGNSKYTIGYTNSENTAWLYDLDFKYLLGDNIMQFITCGKRHKDQEVALLLSGIDRKKIIDVDGWDGIEEKIDYDNIDTIFLLNDIDTLDITQKVKNKIEEKLQRRINYEN